jgi:hypothetical protein
VDALQQLVKRAQQGRPILPSTFCRVVGGLGPIEDRYPAIFKILRDTTCATAQGRLLLGIIGRAHQKMVDTGKTKLYDEIHADLDPGAPTPSCDRFCLLTSACSRAPWRSACSRAPWTMSSSRARLQWMASEMVKQRAANGVPDMLRFANDRIWCRGGRVLRGVLHLGVVDFLTLSETLVLSMLNPAWTEQRVLHTPTSLVTCAVTLYGTKESVLSPAGMRVKDNYGLVRILGMLRSHPGPKRLDLHKQAMREGPLFRILFECNDVLNTGSGHQLRLSGFTPMEARQCLEEVCDGQHVSSLSLDLRREHPNAWQTTGGHMKLLWEYIALRYTQLHTLRIDQPEVTTELVPVHYNMMIEETLCAIDDADHYRQHEHQQEFEALVFNSDSAFYTNLRELEIRAVELTDQHWLQVLLGFRNLTALVLERTSPFPQRQTQLVERVLQHNALTLEKIDLVLGMPKHNTPPADMVAPVSIVTLPVNTQKLQQLCVDVGPGFEMQLTPAIGAQFLPRSHRVHVQITAARARKRGRGGCEDLVVLDAFESTGECTVVMRTGAIRRRLR